MWLTYLGIVGTIGIGKQRTLSNAGEHGQASGIDGPFVFILTLERGITQ
jgi:hypothetical protein